MQHSGGKWGELWCRAEETQELGTDGNMEGQLAAGGRRRERKDVDVVCVSAVGRLMRTEHVFEC